MLFAGVVLDQPRSDCALALRLRERAAFLFLQVDLGAIVVLDALKVMFLRRHGFRQLPASYPVACS